MGLMLAAPAGNDILYDDKLCEQGRNFCNKVWNVFRLVKGWQVDESLTPCDAAREADRWFEVKLSDTVAEVEDLLGKFRLSEALMAIYRLIRDEFSGWYLEMVKPAYGEGIDRETYEKTLGYFDSLLRVLHPFMPFITEELWQHIAERREGESIMYAPLPVGAKGDDKVLADIELAKEIVTGVRGVRASKNIPPKDVLSLKVIGDMPCSATNVIIKLANIDSIEANAAKDASAASFMVGTTEFNVPLKDTIDVAAELERLTRDLEYQQGFLASVEKKLSNERFVNNAPEAVVAAERKKQSDALSKIEALKASIAALS
jgi:valyl-tRNA synthetase